MESGHEANCEVSASAADAARSFLMAKVAMWAWVEPDLRRSLKELTTEATNKKRVAERDLKSPFSISCPAPVVAFYPSIFLHHSASGNHILLETY